MLIDDPPNLIPEQLQGVHFEHERALSEDELWDFDLDIQYGHITYGDEDISDELKKENINSVENSEK